MKYIKISALLLVIFLLVSCGSGGGGSGGTSLNTSYLTIVIGDPGVVNAGVVSSSDYTTEIPPEVETIQIIITMGDTEIENETYNVKGMKGFVKTYEVPDGTYNIQAIARNSDGRVIFIGETTEEVSGTVTVEIYMDNVYYPIYVSNADSDNISTIDPSSFNVTTIECPQSESVNCYEPRNLASDHIGNIMIVPFRHSHNVVMIDTYNNVITDIIDDPSFNEPYAVAVNCDNSEAWVVNKQGNSITIIDMKTRAVKETITLPEEPECLNSPEGIVIANGNAYIANRGNGTVCVIDTSNRRSIISIFIPGSAPRYAVATPNGRYVYVSTDISMPGILKIDTTFNTSVWGILNVRVRNLAITPDGSKLYGGVRDTNKIAVIDISYGDPTQDNLRFITVPGASSIYGVAIDPVTGYGFATDEMRDVVYVFDTATDEVLKDSLGKPIEIPVGSTPRAISSTPAFDTCSG